MAQCFCCSKDKKVTFLTWFYRKEKLVKERLCRECIDNEKVDFYSEKVRSEGGRIRE